MNMNEMILENYAKLARTIEILVAFAQQWANGWIHAEEGDDGAVTLTATGLARSLGDLRCVVGVSKQDVRFLHLAVQVWDSEDADGHCEPHRFEGGWNEMLEVRDAFPHSNWCPHLIGLNMPD